MLLALYSILRPLRLHVIETPPVGLTTNLKLPSDVMSKVRCCDWLDMDARWAKV